MPKKKQGLEYFAIVKYLNQYPNFMVDLYKEAKKRLKSKKRGQNSKLDLRDIEHLLVVAMLDGILTKEEVRELQEIQRYSFENMENKALEVYSLFMDGVKGKPGAKKEDFVNILEIARKVSFNRSKKNPNFKFNDEDIKHFLVLSIQDGRLTKGKLDQLLKCKDYLKEMTTPGGVQLFADFVESYHKRLYPQAQHLNSKKSSPSKYQLTRSSVNQNSGYKPKITQCGTCYGSGTVTCSSCYGMGGRSESRVDYDFEGNPNYRDEWIQCYGCNGGYIQCSNCGGKGQL